MTFAFLNKLEATKPFTEREAWGLFRMAAISEAMGWTVLITGLLIRRYGLPGHNFSVPITGQIHGILFIIYFGILIATYSSLRWPRHRFIVAAIAGVVPLGTLVLEQWASRVRKNEHRKALLCAAMISAIEPVPST